MYRWGNIVSDISWNINFHQFNSCFLMLYILEIISSQGQHVSSIPHWLSWNLCFYIHLHLHKQGQFHLFYPQDPVVIPQVQSYLLVDDMPEKRSQFEFLSFGHQVYQVTEKFPKAIVPSCSHWCSGFQFPFHVGRGLYSQQYPNILPNFNVNYQKISLITFHSFYFIGQFYFLLSNFLVSFALFKLLLL